MLPEFKGIKKNNKCQGNMHVLNFLYLAKLFAELPSFLLTRFIKF
jgi:hypothetical protein